MSAVRVLVVDDSPAFHEAARTLLGLDDRLEVVAAAWSAEQAHDLLEREDVDLVLLDVNLPDENGIEFAARIVLDFPRVCVVLCSSMTRDEVGLPSGSGTPAFVEKYQLSTSMLLTLWRSRE